MAHFLIRSHLAELFGATPNYSYNIGLRMRMAHFPLISQPCFSFSNGIWPAPNVKEEKGGRIKGEEKKKNSAVQPKRVIMLL